MKRALLSSLPFLLMALAVPATAEHRDGWVSLQPGESCIGGTRCGSYYDTLDLPLGRGQIEAVRFYAHDDVGRRRDGKLRVAVGSRILADWVDIERHGRWYEFDARGARGPNLSIRALGDDEVVISNVAVLTGGRRLGRGDGPRGRVGFDRDDRNWRVVETPACIGGRICRGANGDIFEVALSGRPVYGVRFYAHDGIGRRYRGYLRVSLDREIVEPGLDIDRNGRWYELETGGIPARHLTFETLSDDEVVIERVEVLYGGGGRGPNRDWRNRH